MTRQCVRASVAILLCLAIPLSLAYGQSRGRRSGTPRRGNSPGGAWSERTHGGRQSSRNAGQRREQPGAAGAQRTPRSRGPADGPSANRDASRTTGNRGPAANRNTPQATGAQGAVAGAAAANRNTPQATGAQGAAAGAAAADRRTPAVSGAAGYAAVRGAFNNPNMYGRQWYAEHPGAWAPASLSTGAAWAPVSWTAVAGHCGYDASAPLTYDYGNNVTCQNGKVTVGNEEVGTAEEFSQQAADLAETGTHADVAGSENWLPLGVFAMVRNEQQHPHLIMQLAINPQGILRGNFTDEITDHTLPIQGAVDKQTQRAAWTVGDNRQTVMEAGLSNLTEDAAPALIHKNGASDHWLLVRLDQPQQGANDAGGPKGTSVK